MQVSSSDINNILHFHNGFHLKDSQQHPRNNAPCAPLDGEDQREQIKANWDCEASTTVAAGKEEKQRKHCTLSPEPEHVWNPSGGLCLGWHNPQQSLIRKWSSLGRLSTSESSPGSMSMLQSLGNTSYVAQLPNSVYRSWACMLVCLCQCLQVLTARAAPTPLPSAILCGPFLRCFVRYQQVTQGFLGTRQVPTVLLFSIP